MSAIFGRYSPARKRYGDWAFRTIHHTACRADIADMVRVIRIECGRAEAMEFLNYLHWLGTYPVVNSARWIRKYGRTVSA